MNEPKKQNWSWWRWTILAAGIAAFALMLHDTDVDATVSLFSTAGPLLLLGLLPYTLQIGLDALAWRVLLGGLETRPTWRKLFCVRLSTEAVLMSVPAGGIVGEGLKPYLLKKTDNVPAAKTIASIGIKKCLLVYAEAFYLTTALIVGWSLYVDNSHALVGTSAMPIMVMAAILFLLVLASLLSLAFINGGVGDKAHRLLMKLPIASWRDFLRAKRTPFEDTDTSFQELGAAQRRRWVGAWALLLLAWFAEAFETYVLLRLVGIHLPVHHVLAMEACAVFLRNLAFFMPAGLGIQDAGYLAFLKVFGVNLGVAGAAFVILKRSKELAWVAVGYVILMFLEGNAKLAPEPLADPRVDEPPASETVPNLGAKDGLTA